MSYLIVLHDVKIVNKNFYVAISHTFNLIN